MKYNLEAGNVLWSGSPNVPEYAVMGTVEGVLVFYNDINATTAKVTHDWMRELIKENTEQWGTMQQELLDYRHILKDKADSFNQDSRQTEGMLLVFFNIVLCLGFFVFFVRFMNLHLFIFILNVYN